jgi:hypothetical protein
MSSIILSEDDCNFIKSYWDESQSTYSDNSRDLFKIDEVNTISFKSPIKGYFIEHRDHTLLNFIINKLQVIDLKSIQSGAVKITKYSKGHYFAPHHDFNYYRKGAIYKTLVIQLSDPTDYVGGDLYVKDVPQPREQGSYSLFLSSDIHEVKLLEEGIRFSLTIFLNESDFINTKSII